MKRRKRKPFIIEIKTNRQGWVRVKFIRFLPRNKILIKMKDGQVIARKNLHVRWGKVKKIGGVKGINKSYGKYFKTRKRLHRRKNRRRRFKSNFKPKE